MRLLSLASLLTFAFFSSSASAAIFGTGFWNSSVFRLDETTGAITTVTNLPPKFVMGNPVSGLTAGPASITYDPVGNRLLVAGRFSDQIFAINSTTGAIQSTHNLAANSQPSGIATDAAGNIYVSNGGANRVDIFSPTFDLLGNIILPQPSALASGLKFASPTQLLISDFSGEGIFQYDTVSQTVFPFAAFPAPLAQVAVDSTGQVLVGSAAFGSAIYRFTSAGDPLAPINIDNSLLPQPALPYLSFDFTSPSAIVVDQDGKLIVGALGRTNPFSPDDNFQSNGGLWRFNADGSLDTTFGTNLTPISSLAFVPTAIPEPSSFAMLGTVAATWAGYRRRRKRAASKA